MGKIPMNRQELGEDPSTLFGFPYYQNALALYLILSSMQGPRSIQRWSIKVNFLT